MRVHKVLKAGEKNFGGTNASIAASSIKGKNHKQKINSDTENRKYIKNLILQKMEEGKTEEEALDIAMADEVAKEFDYFDKYKIDKREAFRDWVRRGRQNKVKSKNIRENER